MDEIRKNAQLYEMLQIQTILTQRSVDGAGELATIRAAVNASDQALKDKDVQIAKLTAELEALKPKEQA